MIWLDDGIKISDFFQKRTNISKGHWFWLLSHQGVGSNPSRDTCFLDQDTQL